LGLEPALSVRLSVNDPLTLLISHHLRSAPRSQSGVQPDWRRGRLRARRHPQGDAVHQPGVRAAPRVFAFVSMPIDTPTLSLSPPHPSLAVSEATTSKTRAPPRSLPSSRRRRSPTWSAPLPECLLLCQCPFTCLLSHHPHPTPRLQSWRQHDPRPGRLRARSHPQGDADHSYEVRRRP